MPNLVVLTAIVLRTRTLTHDRKPVSASVTAAALRQLRHALVHAPNLFFVYTLRSMDWPERAYSEVWIGLEEDATCWSRRLTTLMTHATCI